MNSSSARFLGSFPTPELLPTLPGPAIVCVGRSNVGKSSLVNTFTGEPISRVSNTPGRTQLINVFALEHHLVLIDLPGYGYAKHAKERRDVLEELIYQALTSKLFQVRLILLIIDGTVGLTELDLEMLAFLRSESLPFAIIANKMDKLGQADTHACLTRLKATIGEGLVFPVSCRTGFGFNKLRDYIAKQS